MSDGEAFYNIFLDADASSPQMVNPLLATKYDRPDLILIGANSPSEIPDLESLESVASWRIYEQDGKNYTKRAILAGIFLLALIGGGIGASLCLFNGKGNNDVGARRANIDIDVTDVLMDLNADEETSHCCVAATIGASVCAVVLAFIPLYSSCSEQPAQVSSDLENDSAPVTQVRRPQNPPTGQQFGRIKSSPVSKGPSFSSGQQGGSDGEGDSENDDNDDEQNNNPHQNPKSKNAQSGDSDYQRNANDLDDGNADEGNADEGNDARGVIAIQHVLMDTDFKTVSRLAGIDDDKQDEKMKSLQFYQSLENKAKSSQVFSGLPQRGFAMNVFKFSFDRQTGFYLDCGSLKKTIEVEFQIPVMFQSVYFNSGNQWVHQPDYAPSRMHWANGFSEFNIMKVVVDKAFWNRQDDQPDNLARAVKFVLSANPPSDQGSPPANSFQVKLKIDVSALSGPERLTFWSQLCSPFDESDVVKKTYQLEYERNYYPGRDNSELIRKGVMIEADENMTFEDLKNRVAASSPFHLETIKDTSQKSCWDGRTLKEHATISPDGMSQEFLLKVVQQKGEDSAVVKGNQSDPDCGPDTVSKNGTLIISSQADIYPGSDIKTQRYFYGHLMKETTLVHLARPVNFAQGNGWLYYFDPNYVFGYQVHNKLFELSKMIYTELKIPEDCQTIYVGKHKLPLLWDIEWTIFESLPRGAVDSSFDAVKVVVDTEKFWAYRREDSD